MLFHRSSSRSRPGGSRTARPGRRRGVSSVLAMMFMVIFGSLAAAMAVVAQGNLRTADSAMKVSRAMSAAETGLVFAARRLASESSRFVVEKGVIDTVYGDELWKGTYSQAADGAVVVLPPTGYFEAVDPVGVAEAIFNAHMSDTHTFVAEAGDATEIDADGALWVQPIAITSNPDGTPNEDGPYFRLKYKLDYYDDEAYVNVTSQGVDGNITRTIQMAFLITKRIEYAIVSPNRIMIGKNVRVEGPLGSRYGLVDGELDSENGDPLVMRSDFYYLNAGLDNKLDTFFAQVVDYDVDGDCRLRVYHPTESVGIAAAPGILVDYDENEYVDDFDLFLSHFDMNGDLWVVYDSDLALAAGLGPMPVEFDADRQLARLIDEALPDRDGDSWEGEDSDIALGFKDGVIDIKDLYAKVRGRLAFAVSRDEWEVAHGDSYQTVVQGAMVARLDEQTVTFEASEEVLRELTTDMFSDSQTWFETQVPDDPPSNPVDFDNQVAAGIAAGGTFTAPDDSTWESIPFDAQGAYDWYQRPIYEDMEFTNVRIPMGNNGLYVNCAFIGVTFIETTVDCEHENWNYAGALVRVEVPPAGSGIYTYELKYPGVTAELLGTPVADTKPFSNNLRFHGCTFIGSIAGITPIEYTHWRNNVQLTGETRFYIDADDPDLALQPDKDDIIATIGDMTREQIEELSKSSILLPGWPVDISNEQATNPEETHKVKLKGIIVAGTLGARGTIDVSGALLMTFRPTADTGPLFYGGHTSAFKTAIGSFAPDGGDLSTEPFGEITLGIDPEATLPDGIPWRLRVQRVR